VSTRGEKKEEEGISLKKDRSNQRKGQRLPILSEKENEGATVRELVKREEEEKMTHQEERKTRGGARRGCQRSGLCDQNDSSVPQKDDEVERGSRSFQNSKKDTE